MVSLADNAIISSTYITLEEKISMLTERRDRLSRIAARKSILSQMAGVPVLLAGADRLLAAAKVDGSVLDGMTCENMESFIRLATGDPWRSAQPTVYEGQLMPHREVVRRARAWHRPRQNARPAPRATPVDSSRIHARGRAHRAPQTRPTATSASSAPSDPDPAPDPDPLVQRQTAGGAA